MFYNTTFNHFIYQILAQENSKISTSTVALVIVLYVTKSILYHFDSDL